MSKKTKYSAASPSTLFRQFATLKVFVVGDVMLDRYWVGSTDRISPEAPVPVVHLQRKEDRAGGAANVALNCAALGAQVSVLTVLGQDETGKILLRSLQEAGISTEFCLQSRSRVTTTKTRIVARHQQVVRLDEEISDELNTKDEHHFIDTCLRAIQIEAPDVLILEDYNKGVLKKNVIEKILTHCRHVGVLTAVDPKQENFLEYMGVDLFKPNLKEVRDALNLDLKSITRSSLKDVHQILQEKLHHQMTLITLSEHGIFYQEGRSSAMLPAHIRSISDVSGAGDTVIAVAAMTYALTGDAALTARLSNLAGGLVCEELGVVPVNKKKLLKEFQTAR